MTEKTSLQLPQFPDWKGLESVDSTGAFWDTQELSDMNNTLIRTVLNLKEINRQLTDHERKKTALELEYKHKFRSILLNATAKTETTKKKLAEIECEELEWNIAYEEEVIRELTRMASALRVDLDILKTISFNLRQELKV